MEDFKFSVDLGGMIDILSNHLYSTPVVFLRELLQNAVDAVSMRKKTDSSFDAPEINITVSENESLIFTDNGSGLTVDEIHKFISVIGQSSKREDKSSFIGRFGIGLLSCFIVTDEIILRSRSVKTPDKVHEWHGFSNGRYSVTEIESDIGIGTEIIIRSDEEHRELFNAADILKHIRYYGLPIPYPIYVSSGNGLKLMANAQFINTAKTHEGILRSGKMIFGTETDYVDYIPLESENGLFSGAAYILPYTVSAASKSRHRIYLKNMLLTEDGSSILPEWAFFLQCFINTDKLQPTASREDFYQDTLLMQAKEEIGECIADYLEELSLCDPKMLAKIVDLHGTALKSVAVENDKLFDIFMPYFIFETSLGNLTGKELASWEKEIYYTPSIDVFRQLRPVFAEKFELIVNVGYVHERCLVEKLNEKGEAHAELLRDDLLAELLEDETDEERFSFMRKIFTDALSGYDCKVMIKRFSPPQLASLYTINTDGELKRDIEHSKENGDSLFSDMLDAFSEEIDETASSILYLNSTNDLIKKLSASQDSEKLGVFALILYVQSLISGGFPVYGKEMNIMNENLIKLIEWGI